VQYGLTAGDLALRKLTAAHLRKLDLGRDAVSASQKSGTAARRPSRNIFDRTDCSSPAARSNLLYLTAEALCNEGDIVLVEDPTYFVFLGILQSRGLRARAVRLERGRPRPRPS